MQDSAHINSISINFTDNFSFDKIYNHRQSTPNFYYIIEYDLLINLLKFSPLNKLDCNNDKSIICFTTS